MSFNSRQDFIDSPASEKIILAQVQAKARVINFSLSSGSIYVKTVSHFPLSIKRNDTELVLAASRGTMSSNTFYYDSITSNLYVWLDDSSDPANSEIVVTYGLFFSNNSISLPNDLTDDTSADVYYSGRIISSPGFKQKIGIDQGLSSIVGSGNLKLQNNDGELDEVFDRFVFDNQPIKIFSWNRDLKASESQIIFKGVITNKKYDSQSITFTVKDSLFELQQNVPQSIFTEDDNVNTDVLGNIKRWIYGRSDGLKLQSTDQIGNGYTISGTVSFDGADLVLTGVGTSFLSETSPGDSVQVETLSFDIDAVVSDTVITMSKVPDYAITGVSATLSPAIPTTAKNRPQFVADHACAKITTTVTNALQFNRITLDDTTGLGEGDFITFVGIAERKEIKNVAPGNIVVLRDNVVSLPAIGSSVTREPVQSVFIDGKTVSPDDYSITTISGSTSITLDTDAEFNITSNRDFNLSCTFTNGSRSISYAGDASLSEIFKPRDYIRPDNLSYTTFYEILSVSDTTIEIRTPFVDPTITDTVTAKLPNYVGDSTIISADVIGKTEDGLPSGQWLKTSAEVVKDLLKEVGLTDVDSTSFDHVSSITPQLMSLTIPLSPTGGSVSVKDAIDLVNKSTRCALTFDKDLTLKYESVLVNSPQTFIVIDDSDVISWSIESTNGKNYRNSTVGYRHTDVNRETLAPGNKVATSTSEFVKRYVGTNKTFEDNFYIYDDVTANIAAEREVYYNSLGVSTIKIKSDLRLENIDIGDAAVLDFARLYKRFGDVDTRRKLVTCVGKTASGDNITLEFSDYGNTFNTSAFITDNTSLDYSLSDTDSKIRDGFITDTEGIVNDIEDTNKTNLIS